MPEGPEVRVITDWLSNNFEGFIIRDNSKFPSIKNYVILSINCKGKQIFIELINNQFNRLYLNIRLGMTGKFSLTEGKHTRFWLSLESYQLIGYNLTTNIIKLYFDDTRNFGAVELLSSDGYLTKLNEIGPDLLSENVPLDLWISKITNPKIKSKQICQFLLDQSQISGIGNYCKIEILYKCKIRPDRTLCELSSTDVENLYHTSISTLKESYSYGGLTIKDFWSPTGEKGMFPVQVYNKKVDPLGNPIITGVFKDGRSTQWVPNVQM